MTRHVFALAVAALPFVVACDALKKDHADAAVVIAPAAATGPTDTAAQTAAAPVAPVAPLGVAAATHPGAKLADGGKAVAAAGKPVEAGAPADGGSTAPTPTPVFTFPTAIPGFDAGAFKPPPGFPSTLPTLPTFPPPPASAPR